MSSVEPTPQEIDTFVDQLVDTASRIRLRINDLDPVQRRSRTAETPHFSNQYEIDVMADNIIHDDFADFNGYIVSEERELDKTKMEENELLLIVDPVDGSTNASRDIGYWSFSAALAYSGHIIAGVVVDQVTRRVFVAKLGSEAYMISNNGVSLPMTKNSFTNNEVGNRADNFASSLICFNSHEGPSIPFRHLRNFGSSALAICDVACGGLDAYIDDEDILLRPWDILAAEFIAKSCGCDVYRRDSDGLMAATGVLVTRSESLKSDFKGLFPHFFH